MIVSQASADLYEYENEARESGYRHIVGIDEVGRGPLAGPVVAAAVKLPNDISIEGLSDSKKISASRRKVLYQTILNHPGIDTGIALVSSQEIDRINILQATHLAMRRAVLQIKSKVDFILVDGLPVPNLPYPSNSIIKGDAKSASIGAASIIAKVYRDNLMVELDDRYPGYGFNRHKGYGTPEHVRALSSLGPCAIHRRSFAPVANLI